MGIQAVIWLTVISLFHASHYGSDGIFADGLIVKHFHPKTESHQQTDSLNRSPSTEPQQPPNKPLCTIIKKTVPGMKDGNFITRDPGHWRVLQDGSRSYEPQTCTLQRFTADEARQCLSGHHLLMIGDSMMRYQFLSLAYFIEHGHWEHRFPMSENCQHKNHHGQTQCSPWNEPNILTEKDWAQVYGHSSDKSWKELHRFIGGKGFNGHMDCQCLRHDDIDKSLESMFYQNTFSSLPSVEASSSISSNSISAAPNGQPTRRPSMSISAMENLRNRRPSFQSRSNSSHRVHSNNAKRQHRLLSVDDNKSIKLTFLVNLNNSDMHLLTRSHCEETGSCQYDDQLLGKILQDVESGKHWELNNALLPALDRSVLSKVLPDVDIAIYNNGLWAGGYPDVSFISQVMEKLSNLTHKQEDSGPLGRCFWKGTSPAFHIPAFKKYPALFAAADEPYRIAAMKSGCQVLDIAHVTKNFAAFNYHGGYRNKLGDEFEDEQMAVYADAAHFQPWVNEELNQILLNVLC